jgi:hypothetical protein
MRIPEQPEGRVSVMLLRPRVSSITTYGHLAAPATGRTTQRRRPPVRSPSPEDVLMSKYVSMKAASMVAGDMKVWPRNVRHDGSV